MCLLLSIDEEHKRIKCLIHHFPVIQKVPDKLVYYSMNCNSFINELQCSGLRMFQSFYIVDTKYLLQNWCDFFFHVY